MKNFLIFLKSYGLLTVLIAAFLFLGVNNIAKFETVDEHFWKYERIPQYWQALQDGNLKKTAVNDKPGITVAFFNGAGLLFADPTTHRIRNESVTQNGSLTLYNANQTEKLNLSLRLPGIFINMLLLIVIFTVSRKVFESNMVSLTLTAFIALSPILIGIGQIINPDTYLWSFSFTAFLLWLWYLKEPTWIKVSFVGFALGFTILSKYTGLILFPALFFFIFVYGESKPQKIWQYVKGFIGASIIAILTLVLLLPATLVKPNLLWHSTAGFFAEQGVLWPLIGVSALFIALLSVFPQKTKTGLGKLNNFLTQYVRYLVIPFALFFIGTFFLGIGNQPFIPLEAHYLSSKENETLAFPLLEEDTHPLIRVTIQMIVQLYPLIFSLHPLAFGAITFFLLAVILGRSRLVHQSGVGRTTLFITWFSIAFVFMNLVAGVLINARYGIILFPLWYLLAAFGTTELVFWLKERYSISQKPLLALFTIFVLVLFANAYQAKPFLFNYTSPFLKKDFVIHDAWGYGLYQASEYFNSLPANEKPIYIWSDRNGMCQFLLPHIQCVSGYKIDGEKTPLSYLVISKRGLERGYKPRYLIPGTEKSQQVAEYIGIEKTAVWRLDILGRKDNFIMIVPVGKEE